MVVVEKKIPPEFYELVSSGKKRFELRVADFDIKEGDTLVLKEWDPKKEKYTGRQLRKKVGYVLKYDLDRFGQRKLIEEYGMFAIQLE